VSERFGATPEDWAQFDVMLGLTADLLPVVSNPGAVISPNSKMKALGKTPSVYNKQRKVAGFPSWTEHKATGANITEWSAEPDYGICIQTREVRALDVDVEDKEKAAAIGEFIGGHLNALGLPERYREGSGKFLLAFRLQGVFAKRILKVEGGIIEFLANGQQFIAAGTHTSGVRYEWEWWGHDNFPLLSEEEFELLWAALVKEFGVAQPSEGAVRKCAETVDLFDPTLEHLDILSWGKDGQAFITCPFETEHTMDSGETQTAYFPRGTRGYEQGHFVCLHAHCAERTDADFLDALGIRMKDFEVIEEESKEVAKPLPSLERDKLGRILATIPNLEKILQRPDVCRNHIRFDTFRDEIVFSDIDSPGEWQPFRDVDYTRLRGELELKGFRPVSKEMMRDVVHRVAGLNPFDTATVWLEGLKWDGVERVASFLRDYFGAEDSDYTRDVSIYMWTALAGRVLVPGVKADMVPVLIGNQGVGKSYGVSELVPSFEFTETINLLDRDADLARRMRGKLVIEFGELRGLHTRDMESIKEFITRTYESWVPKYQEFAQKYPRRCVFIGTTNQEEFLADTTGNRRWLPVRCGKVDVNSIRTDRLQLWAEARELFRLIGGVAWSGAQEAATEVHDEHRMSDVWADEIARWLCTVDDADGTAPANRKCILMTDVLRDALHFDLRNVKRGDELRVASILREQKFTRKILRVDGVLRRVWVKS